MAEGARPVYDAVAVMDALLRATLDTCQAMFDVEVSVTVMTSEAEAGTFVKLKVT